MGFTLSAVCLVQCKNSATKIWVRCEFLNIPSLEIETCKDRIRNDFFKFIQERGFVIVQERFEIKLKDSANLHSHRERYRASIVFN